MPTVRRIAAGGLADLNDTLVHASVQIDDGCDHTQRIIWAMNNKRHMRNGVAPPRPEAIQVAAFKIEPKKKPRKRGFKVVQKAIGAV